MTTPNPLLDAVRLRYQARSFVVDGCTWSVRDTGATTPTAIPLVLLPGALGTGDVFYQVLAELGSDRRIITVSFPPLGDARLLAEGFTRLLDAMELPLIDLLGTSLGGYVAQLVALQNPARLRKLVLANTFWDPGLQQSRWPAAPLYAQRTPTDVLAAARAQLESGAEPTPEHAELKRVMLGMVGGEQDGQGVKAMRLAVLTAVPLPRVPLADAAIVLIDDDEDPVIAPETRAAMRERYAGCLQIRIKGGGHFPANLRPADYRAAIMAALA
jgi:pimeloyl-ACP methyl ester carboxylesterase